MMPSILGRKTSPDFLKEKGTLRGALASLLIRTKNLRQKCAGTRRAHKAVLLDLYIQTNQAVELRSAPYLRQMKSPKQVQIPILSPIP
jgi:hypothetical protein